MSTPPVSQTSRKGVRARFGNPQPTIATLVGLLRFHAFEQDGERISAAEARRRAFERYRMEKHLRSDPAKWDEALVRAALEADVWRMPAHRPRDFQGFRADERHAQRYAENRAAGMKPKEAMKKALADDRAGQVQHRQQERPCRGDGTPRSL